LILRSLKVRHFRNLGHVDLSFHDQVNLFVGPNGQGKTNLLEAIYYLGTTKSFRTIRIPNLVSLDKEDLFVEGTGTVGGVERSLSAGYRREDRKRELLVNGNRVTVRDFVSTLPLFAYSSSRLEILRGGPEARRRFLDRGIATHRPAYLSDLSRNRRALRQRNALLQEIARGREKQESLDAWDHEWASTSSTVVRERRAYCENLGEKFREIVADYRYPLESLEIQYAPTGSFEEPGEGLDNLRRIRKREIAAGFSLVGPHRDNVDFTFRGIPADEVLSSGETKMVVLFLKMAKTSIFTGSDGQPPIFLLDDVDAELDLGIIERLLFDLRDRAQLFTTSSKESIFGPMAIGTFQKYTVENGSIRLVDRVASG